MIPAGTANDFARATGLPRDRVAAAELAVTGTELRRYELGRLGDGHPFVNVASAGLASVAARRADPLKPRLGPLAYAAGAVHAAVAAAPLPCTVRADGATVFEGEAWQVIVAVTGAFGGGSGVGAADPSDGVLDVAVIPAGSRIGLARRAWGLKRHTIAEQRGVEHHRGRVLELRVPDGDGVQRGRRDPQRRAGAADRRGGRLRARRRRLTRVGGDDAQPAGAAPEARRPGHDPVDVAALEHLVAQQLPGQLVELARGARTAASRPPAAPRRRDAAARRRAARACGRRPRRRARRSCAR